jgi:hypothetical protein
VIPKRSSELSRRKKSLGLVEIKRVKEFGVEEKNQEK